MIRSLFISHESPMMLDTNSPAREYLQQLERMLNSYEFILAVGAHWQTENFSMSLAQDLPIIYDFAGFDQHYYLPRDPYCGSPKRASKLREDLEKQGFSFTVDNERGLDHSLWMPFEIANLNRRMEIIPLSISQAKPQEHFLLGQALRQWLADQNGLVLASGTMTHNLRAFFSGEPPAVDHPADPRALAFSSWFQERMEAGRYDELFAYKRNAPEAYWAHPSADHILPLFVAMGAGQGHAILQHESVSYGSFAMHSWAWN